MERIAETVNKYLLYLITSYVLIDYGLRHTGYSMLASLWDEILFIIIVGLWVIWAAIKGIRPIASNLLLPLLLFYAVLVFNFLTRSPEPQIALTELRALVEYTFWFFIALNLVSTRQQVKNLLDIFLLVGVLVALYGIYQYATGAEIPPHWIDRAETGITTRAFSFIGSPNVLGSFLILNINIAFASFLASHHWFKKRVYLLIAVLALACLVFTLSRGAWLVFFFSFVLLGLWLDKRVIIILLIIVCITPVVVPSVYNRVAYMLSPEYIQSSSQGGRIALWSQAIDYWQGDPVVGLGMGRFGGGVAIANFPQSAYSVDNFYIKLAVELGLIGLSAFIYLLLSALRLAKTALERTGDRHLRKVGTGILTGLIGVMGHNMVENMFEFPLMAVYFWFFLGILVVLPAVKDDKPGVAVNG
jgi:O-antigen ligase